jgi:hypothetical protein
VLLRVSGNPAALLRLSDKRGGQPFDEVDRSCAERLAAFSEIALRNARHLRSVERRALQDPATGAHRLELLHDVLQREIERAARFGRSFSVAKLRSSAEDTQVPAARDALIASLRSRLRAADLLALAADGSILVLLADTDSLGAATFKRRLREWLHASDAERISVAVASCPADGSEWGGLARCLDARLARDASASAFEQSLGERGIRVTLSELLESGRCEPVETASALARFAVSEVGRHPRERNLFFFHPGTPLANALGALDARRAAESATEVIVVAPSPAKRAAEGRVSFVSPEHLSGCLPFAIHYGDGPPYALVCGEQPGPDGLRLFHTSDRETVEALAFRLQRELRMPTLA